MSTIANARTAPQSSPFSKGYVQVYTGDGKGKTTAAIGLAVRAAGAGLRIFIAQFMKNGDYSEIRALGKHNRQIDVKQFGTGCFIKNGPTDIDRKLFARGLDKVKAVLSSRAYQVVIMEEANMAAFCGLIAVDDLLDLMQSKPEEVELIITGRYAHAKIIAAADLVTEMREVKHYYRRGVQGRVGIEK